MRIKSIFLGLAAALMATASLAGRATDGNVSIIYWQAPSILNPYLSSGTKDIESASLVIEPLGRYDETGALVPFLAEEIPTVANGGVSADLTSITWKLKKGLISTRNLTRRLSEKIHFWYAKTTKNKEKMKNFVVSENHQNMT